jgi:TPR repeat protein
MKKEAALALMLAGLWAAPSSAQQVNEALYQNACENNRDATACSVLALEFETGRTLPRDLARAASLYEQACELGDLEACTIVGSMYHTGQGVARDLARAISFHERACDGGELLGCESLGLLYETGSGVLQDYARAAALYSRSCDGNLAAGCNRLGMLLQNGQGVPANPEVALERFAQACDAGYLEGCVNLGVGFERGEGVDPDPAQAFTLYEYACDNGEMLGCVNLGSLHRTGTGVAQDPRLAVSLYRRACDAGEPLGCFNLGVSYEGGVGVPQDVVTAISQFQRACAGGLTIGCERLPTAAREQSEPVDSSVVATFGRVADAETEEPIRDAIIDMPDLGIRLVSDENGRVDLPDLPTGSHLIRAEAVGYAVTEGRLRVPGEADFLVLLEHDLVADPGAAGRLVGRVTDETGQGGIGDVEISILNRLTGRTVTNQQGRFGLEGISPGLAEIRFERLGYETRTSTIVIQPGRTKEILAYMSTEPIPLDPIRVVAVRSEYLERNGFYDRAIRNWGTQFGPADLQSLLPTQLSDLIYYTPGVVIEGGNTPGAPQQVWSRRRYGEGCQLDIYVDQVRQPTSYNFNEIPPMQVEAVEIYQGLDTPVQFQRRSSESGCGVVLVWTKRGA